MSATADKGHSDFIDFSREMFSWIGELLIYGLRLVRNYWYIFLILTGGAITFQYWKYKQTPKVYSATAQLGHNELVKKTYGEMILELQRLIDHRSYEALSELLDFPREKVDQIVSICATNVAGSALHEDVTLSSLPFYLHVQTRDRESIKMLEHGLQFYLEHNAKNKKVFGTNLKVLREKLEFYEAEIDRVNQIINSYESALKGSELESTLDIDLPALFRLLDELEEKKTELAFGVEHYRPIEYVYGFTTTDDPYKDFSKRSALVFVIFFIFLSFGLAWIIDLFEESRTS